MHLSFPPFLLLRSPLQSLKEAYAVPDELSPLFREGLYLASPDFWQEFRKATSRKGNGNAKLERALLKYRIRSCMRSTPFGTFAGIALIDVTRNQTSIIRDDECMHHRNIRVDMDYLAQICEGLSRLAVIRPQLRVQINNSLYDIPDGYRYAAYTNYSEFREYQLISVRKSSYLQAVLALVPQAATIGNLVNMLQASEGVSPEEASSFIDELIQSQILVSELEPCVTGGDPLDTLIEQLRSLDGTEEQLSSLEYARYLMRHPDGGEDQYSAIEAALRNLGIQLQKPKSAIQSDLHLATRHNCIHTDLLASIVQQAEDLLRLSVQRKQPQLEDFKSRFDARYEEAEVPLAIALDADLGIGYAAANDEAAGGGVLVDALPAPAVKSRDPMPGYLEQFVVSKYHQYLKDRAAAVEITGEDLQGLKVPDGKYRFPNSMYLFGSLLKKDGALDKDHFEFDISGFNGPSAGSLLGRFTQGNEPLCKLTRELLKAEEAEHPDAIYAELVHLPQTRLGNILLRPLLRGYEIPYIGKSGAVSSHQIGIDDLMVSIRNGDVYLRSKAHNKRVIPRLSTAHNYSYGSLPVYQFLCDLQFQGLAYPATWNWGPLDSLKHLPRVAYKNMILRKARWRMAEKDIEDLPRDPAGYHDYFLHFRLRHGLPERVVYAESDNELLIDLTEARGIDLFLHYLKRNKHILLEEFLFEEDNCIVRDADGNPYTNELIIPLYQEPPPVREPLNLSPVTNSKRKFPPGSEWLYVKVYCGSKTAEGILRDTVLPFIEHGLETRLFEQFFFIRYRDEWNHLRIRFFNRDTAKLALLQESFLAALDPLLQNGLIDKLALDTYSRESERYGPDLVEATEALYFHDSLAVLRAISLLETDEDEQYRWLLALRGVDMLLDDFGLDLAGKRALLQSIQAAFFRGAGGAASLQKHLNESYRERQAAILSHLDPALDGVNEIEEAVAIFQIRSAMNAPLIHEMKRIKEANAKSPRLMDLLPAYLHMNMNRMFIAQQRKYELVLYHFLEKYYASRLARAAHEKGQEPGILQPQVL